jgi:flagellar hook-length control protein FliK
VLHGVHHSVQPSATLTAAADYTLSLQKPGWQADLGELVARMQIRGQRLAEVRLDPPDLGPIRIHLSHGADHTQVVLQAQHPDTRLLLQMTADRLRDNLAESGHAQVQVQVQVGPDSGSGAFSRSDRDTASGFGTPGRAHHGSETFDDAPMEITHLRLSGRLDLFA